MHTKLIILAATCTLTAATLAQEAPTPPAQVTKFGVVLGTWQGSGTTTAEAGGEAMPWTASMEVTRILDGFFVQEELQVDVGTPTPIQMRTIYAYDTENQRYVACSMSNAGPAHFGEFYFPERGVMTMDTTHVVDGKPVFARARWRMGRDGLSYSSRMVEGTGAMRPHVDGTFERADSLPQRSAAASFMDVPVPDEMKELTDRMAGSYDLKGTMLMMPGMPEMTISGEEIITPQFGGHVLASVITGKAEGSDAPYRARVYITWNPHDGCYDFVSLDNMGAVGKSQGRWAGDDELVTTWSGLMMGQPSVSQGIVRFGDHGMSAVDVYSIVGTSTPMKAFSATYQRRSD